MAIQAASGVLLLICTAAALFLANSPWADQFAGFWETHLRVGVGRWELDESLLHWINDGLMTIFFFVVGLEIKRELVGGELSEWRKAALPVMAALGGMVVPAAIYLLLMRNQPVGKAGWGIPMATDIAFVVGFLALLGRRAPPGIKIFLLALAIIDDIGAIVVIAVFYSHGLDVGALQLAAAGLGLILACRWLGVRRIGVYALLGVGVWLAMLHSGVHPTITGVIIGLMTPSRAMLPHRDFVAELTEVVDRFGREAEPAPPHGHGHQRVAEVKHLATAAQETLAPLERLETTLHPWVAFAIMPLFALANAGVPLDARAVTHPIAISVALGLVVGKPVGIVLLSWIAVRLGIARLPAETSWRVIAGAGCLAGIGFTMSIFIAQLGLEGELLTAGKIGAILGSVVSATLGLTALVLVLPKPGPTWRS
jgi:NhaA family Na+:H+ antiporter